MKNKEDILEVIDNLSMYLHQSRQDIDELADLSRDLATDAESALDDTDAALTELDKLSELIEADEIELDEDTVRDLTGQLLEARRDISSSLGEYQALIEHIEPASQSLSKSAAAQQDVVSLVRRAQ